MEAAARPLPDSTRVKFRAERGRLPRGASVCPIEDWGGWRPGGVDPHQTVPERGAADGGYACGRIAEARDDAVDGLHGQIEQRLSREGGAAVQRCLQSVGELLYCVADRVTEVVERQGPHRRC